jgi:high-affinity nickel permease
VVESQPLKQVSYGSKAEILIAALIAFGDRPVLLGTAFLAYMFGLRHAFRHADPVYENAT